MRAFVILAVILGSAWFGLHPSRLYLVLLVGLFGAILLFPRIPLGLLLLPPVSLWVGFGLGTGTQSGINAAILLVIGLTALWGLDLLIVKRSVLKATNTLPPLVVFTVVVTLSLIVGNFPLLSHYRLAPIASQLAGAATFFLSFLTVLLVANHYGQGTWLARAVFLFLAIGAVFIVGRTVPGVKSLVTRLYAESSTGSVFWIWIVALSASQALVNRKLSWFWRLTLGGLAVFSIFSSLVFYRSWISGWLPPIVALMVILFFFNPRLAIIASLAGLLLVALKWQSLLASVLFEGGQYGSNQWSLLTRLEASAILLREVWKINPVLGIGPANSYWFSSSFSLMNYFVNFNSHNQYVDIFTQTGLLGIGCFIWLVAAFTQTGLKALKGGSHDFKHAYAIGALGGLAGMVVTGFLGDWVIPFVYNIGLSGMRSSLLGWFFLGGLVALEQVAPPGSPDADK